MDLLAIVWNVSPYVHQFSSTYAIRWYGILFAIAFVSAYYILFFISKKEHFPESTLNKMAIAVVIGGVLGSRLGHCLFYEPSFYLHHPIQILHIWQGGMSSHGGAIGVLIAYLFIARNDISYKEILSRTMLVTPLAGFFFRMGNLMNSEIYGYPTDLPWGFIFVNSPEVLSGIEQAIPRHPTQIYEMICYLLLFIFFMCYCHKTLKTQQTINDWFVIGMFLIITFGTRFIIEFLKLPQVEIEQNMIFNIGQLLSIPFIIFGIFALIKGNKNAKNSTI